ncbi:RNA methyltransferase [Undibacterium sp. TS12]|uniref:RNA methyltransferase n=1 Tax=Undibacterium sp. TS12 TaxID=2908202 RepID=UPI001F4CF467|nr:RNA methyltransferase [Undibacterium sp. TS12]MCH8618622.1 RNA methyltransferase [Undibacterium sp. TS12]
MNLPKTDTSLFQRLRIILVETSHPGNVGAAARAIKTMGFHELVLVNPRFDDVLSNPEAIAFASGAQDILNNTRIVASIDEALHGCEFVAAVSARLREFSPPVLPPRAFAESMAGSQHARIGLIFGSERFGLPNDIVMNCNALINIPANPQYSSLNLAQAIQLLTYECRVATDSALSGIHHIGFEGKLASSDEIDGMYRHLEQALIAIQFLNPDNPKKLMPRLKRMLARAQLEVEEVNIMRGIAKHILDLTTKKQ